jgi:hypothetical protein
MDSIWPEEVHLAQQEVRAFQEVLSQYLVGISVSNSQALGTGTLLLWKNHTP